jgi:hypothetical protein
MISNGKVAKYKVVDLFECYNFVLGSFSIQGNLEIAKKILKT